MFFDLNRLVILNISLYVSIYILSYSPLSMAGNESFFLQYFFTDYFLHKVHQNLLGCFDWSEKKLLQFKDAVKICEQEIPETENF